MPSADPVATDLIALPEPYEAPVQLRSELCRLGGRGIAAYAEALLGDEEVFHVVRSRARHDVGVWFRRPRIWVFATAGELVLGAWSRFRQGPAPLERRIDYAALRAWIYNDVTGELLVKTRDPTDDLPGLRMAPLDGYQLLAQIRKGLDHG